MNSAIELDMENLWGSVVEEYLAELEEAEAADRVAADRVHGVLLFCCEENELGGDCSCRVQFDTEQS